MGWDDAGGASGSGGAAAMSGYVRRPLLPAPVGPLACSVIVSRFGAEIEETARKFEETGSPQGVDAARQLRDALAAMGESARLRNLAQAGAGSASGTSEPVGVTHGATSGSSPWTLLTVSQVAEQLRVSRRYVTSLCVDGRLSATKPGRAWLIEAVSVADYQTVKEQTA